MDKTDIRVGHTTVHVWRTLWVRLLVAKNLIALLLSLDYRLQVPGQLDFH